MKVIAFSLWGNDKLYCQGAIDNIECAKQYYPDWKCMFYVTQNCPALPVLEASDCIVKTVCRDAYTVNREHKNWHQNPDLIGMLWRFCAIDDPDVDIAIFRDCDSRVGARDAQAVQEWLENGATAHRMHECKEHWNAQMMGGMWGVHTQRLNMCVKDSIDYYIKNYQKIRNEPWIFVDLWWIMDMLWPHIKHDCMGHGYGHPHKFTIDGPLVGSVVHEEWRGQKYG
jgi:hypothetical protein